VTVIPQRQDTVDSSALSRKRYVAILPITQEGEKLCQNVQIAQRTRKGPKKNGLLGDSELRCTNALDVEINLESIIREARFSLG
jgi:hypothetical protein